MSNRSFRFMRRFQTLPARTAGRVLLMEASWYSSRPLRRPREGRKCVGCSNPSCVHPPEFAG